VKHHDKGERKLPHAELNGAGIYFTDTGVVERESCADLLSKINIPVGIGVGDEDVASVPEKSEYILGKIQGSELALFKSAGHSSSIEAPSLVNDLIERTVRRSE
jgi:pimeloyl-ACP methyl ester carboxylesterase